MKFVIRYEWFFLLYVHCPSNLIGFLQALEQFSAEAPIPDDDMDNEALYDKKVSL